MPSPEMRKKIIWVAGTIAVCFFALQFAPPIAEYLRSPYAGLIREIAVASRIGLLGVGLIVWLLMRTGILPTVKQETTVPPYRISARGMFLNVIFWIVIAVSLVFFFNLAHDKSFGFGALDDRTVDLMIKVCPLILIFGVWAFFFWRMQVKKRRGPDGGNAP